MANQKISQVNLSGNLYDIYDASAVHSQDLVSALFFKGSLADEATIKNLTSATAGWIYHATKEGTEWLCTKTISAKDATAWEEIGNPFVDTHVHDFSATQTINSVGVTGKVSVPQASGTTKYLKATVGAPQLNPSTEQIVAGYAPVFGSLPTDTFYAVGDTASVSKGVTQTQKKLTTTSITGVGSSTVEAVTGVAADGTHSFGMGTANKSTWSFNVNPQGVLVIEGGNGTDVSCATTNANATVLTGVKATGTQTVATKATKATTVATGGLSETSVTTNVGGTIVTEAKSSGSETVAKKAANATTYVTGGNVVTDLTEGPTMDVVTAVTADAPTIALTTYDNTTAAGAGAVSYIASISNSNVEKSLINGATGAINVSVSGTTQTPK